MTTNKASDFVVMPSQKIKSAMAYKNNFEKKRLKAMLKGDMLFSFGFDFDTKQPIMFRTNPSEVRNVVIKTHRPNLQNRGNNRKTTKGRKRQIVGVKMFINNSI